MEISKYVSVITSREVVQADVDLLMWTVRMMLICPHAEDYGIVECILLVVDKAKGSMRKESSAECRHPEGS